MRIDDAAARVEAGDHAAQGMRRAGDAEIAVGVAIPAACSRRRRRARQVRCSSWAGRASEVVVERRHLLAAARDHAVLRARPILGGHEEADGAGADRVGTNCGTVPGNWVARISPSIQPRHWTVLCGKSSLNRIAVLRSTSRWLKGETASSAVLAWILMLPRPGGQRAVAQAGRGDVVLQDAGRGQRPGRQDDGLGVVAGAVGADHARHLVAACGRNAAGRPPSSWSAG